ncbi:MAG: outer membrane beta-barrel protein [Candidatus Eisenbacteria bacterium]
MKRVILAACLAVALVGRSAHAGSIGVGVFGGLSVPVVQSDVEQGSMFGVRVPIKLVPLVAVEPYFASSALGDAQEDVLGVTYTREGFDSKAYGANVMLTMGGPLQFYPFAGIGQTKLKRPGSDLSLTTYNFGLGLGISPAPKISVHIRGELAAAVDGEASRKFANATVGLSYALFSAP